MATAKAVPQAVTSALHHRRDRKKDGSDELSRPTLYTYRSMTQSDVLTMFRQSGALLEGHFRLTSGLHSPGYLQCALVLQHPKHAETLGSALGNLVRPLGAVTRADALSRFGGVNGGIFAA